MKVTKYSKLFYFLILVAPIGAMANEVATIIEKRSSNFWKVSYSTETPVKKIAFKRTPAGFRVSRWKSVSGEFSIVSKDNLEYIKRLDGKSFKVADFELTPRYVSLPKEYAPFSPFSDGGMLLYSGLFFACIEVCGSDVNKWKIKVVVPKSEHVIVDGKVHDESVSWLDSDSGRKIYIGKGVPISDKHFISVIDEQLPERLKTHLNSQLPKLIGFFSHKLGKLASRPSLFASYSESDDGAYGRQGGTLPGQVFMHWYGAKAIEQIDNQSTYWFFAHEVAHIYQREAGRIEEPKDAWIHEGSAEIFAGLASEKGFLKKKLDSASRECIDTLKRSSSYFQASSLNPNLHYSCGLVIMNHIDEDIRNNSKDMDIFTLWGLFNQKVLDGSKASASTFASTAEPYLSKDMNRFINSLAINRKFNPVEFLKKLNQKNCGDNNCNF